MPPAKIRRSTNKPDLAASAASVKAEANVPQKTSPSWLTISMDAALGFRANVFQVTRIPTASGGKKSSGSSASNMASTISIHPGE